MARFTGTSTATILSLGVMGSVAPVFATSLYTVTDLGALGGTDGSYAYAINKNGQVVGEAATSESVYHEFCINWSCWGYWKDVPAAFLWANEAMTSLESSDSAAHAINDRGQVVGYAEVGWWDDHAFLWDNSVGTDLGTLGGSESQACGINNLGQIVGWSETTDWQTHAFLWVNDTMTDLGILGGSGGWDEAHGINNVGQVVGWSQTIEGQDHAFLISPEDTNQDGVPDRWYRDENSDGVNDLMMDLGTLGGTESKAHHINDAGQIVGWSQTADGQEHAFLIDPEDTDKDNVPDRWRRDQNSDGVNDLMRDLGTLGGATSRAYCVNDAGQVVGWSETSDAAQHAFFWKGGTIIDLNTSAFSGTDCTLTDAQGINDAGQIVGTMSCVIGSHPFLMNPPDCNNNGMADELDVANGISRDSNGNGVPDECESELKVNVQGEGSVDPSSRTYAIGEEATLTATPAEGWRFDRWEGAFTGTQNPAGITMDADKNVTAVFVKLRTLVVNTDGEGSVAPAGGVFDTGSEVTLTATSAEGWRFDHWEGALTDTQNPARITMDADKNATAVFVKLCTLVVNTDGEGSVAPASGVFDAGQEVMLTATPAEGWRFNRWEGAVTGNQNPSTITLDTNQTVTAIFIQTVDPPIVSDGTGSGMCGVGTAGAAAFAFLGLSSVRVAAPDIRRRRNLSIHTR